MGTPAFAVPSLQALIDHDENVVAVVTQPDRPKGRGRKQTPPPIKVLAESANIPVLQPAKVRTADFIEALSSFSPDIFLVAAYGRILSPEVLAVPPLGCINVHGSILPRYRGAAPIQWAILKGEKETGITIMQMDEGMDTGDILLPGTLAIEEDDTAATLADKLASLGGALLIEALDKLRDNNLPPLRQDELKATIAPLLKKEDGLIEWQQTARYISCRIRGLDPWPTAYTFLNGERIRLFKPEIIKKLCTDIPGTIVEAAKDGLIVATGKNYLRLCEIQKNSGKRMSVSAFLSGHPIEPGSKFSKTATNKAKADNPPISKTHVN
jgi:methionyl-tRNA formyltransferase